MQSSATTLRDQGIRALHDGSDDLAVDLLSRALIADGRDWEARACLGIAYSRKGFHSLALKSLEDAVAGAPGAPNYRFNLGLARERSGDVAGAAECYEQTLELQPDHAQARARLERLTPTPVSRPEPAGGLLMEDPPPPVPAPHSQTEPPDAGEVPAPGTEGVPAWSSRQERVEAAPAPAMEVARRCARCGHAVGEGNACVWCAAPAGGQAAGAVSAVPVPAGLPAGSSFST